MIIFHHPESVRYQQPGHPESPDRILGSHAHLATHHPEWLWIEATEATDAALLRAHSPEHLTRLRTSRARFDADTPSYPNIALHASRSAGAAISAARRTLQSGDKTFCLMRPPGHHATRDVAMGFCYFSSVAIAALDLLAKGVERVAIWDVDAHHGNGIEEILLGNPGIRFASVHQYPGYPGTGRESVKNCFNHPVPPGTPAPLQMQQLEASLAELMAFKPQILLVSAGFDAYGPDPITHLQLRQEDFVTLGKWLSQAGTPASAVLEGGYSSDLPLLIDAFLTAWEEN
ncbi:MAG: histone deacetylase [Verrucomicrobiia bacterium]